MGDETFKGGNHNTRVHAGKLTNNSDREKTRLDKGEQEMEEGAQGGLNGGETRQAHMGREQGGLNGEGRQGKQVQEGVWRCWEE